jgi:hypothetical protein
VLCVCRGSVLVFVGFIVIGVIMRMILLDQED